MTFALVLCLSGALSAAEPRQPPTIAIFDFDATPSGRVLPPPQLGATAAQLLLDRLVASGQYRVFDAHWLEPNGPNNTPGDRWRSRARAQAAAAGADYVVLGTITRFSEEHRRRGLGGAALPLPLPMPFPLLGGFNRDRRELVIDVVARVVDAKSGEVVASATGDGIAARTNRTAGGFGLMRAVGGGGYLTQSSDARDAQLAEAIERSIASLANGLVNAAARLVQR